MRIPSKVRVGVEDWDIIECDQVEKDSNRGVTYPELRRIVIDEALPQHLKNITLLHELIHVCYEGIAENSLNEEEVATMLAPQLYNILEQNNYFQ